MTFMNVGFRSRQWTAWTLEDLPNPEIGISQ